VDDLIRMDEIAPAIKPGLSALDVVPVVIAKWIG